MTSSENFRIAIVGAGLTGLLIANGLDRLGIKYDIFEQEVPQSKRRREWSMGVHWSLEMLKNLITPQKAAQLVKRATVDCNLDYSTAPANGALIYDGVSGEVLKDLVVDGTMLRVSRKRLRALLMEDVNVQFEHSLTSLETTADGIKLGFSDDDHTGIYDLVIGCDGPQSTVRAFMYGGAASAAAADNNLHWRQQICYHDAVKAKHVRSAHPVVAMAIHPELFFFLSAQDAHDPENAAEWNFILDISWRQDSQDAPNGVEAVKVAKKKADTLCEPFRSAIHWIPDDTVLQGADLKVWMPLPLQDRLTSSRVVLAGDAAHPMPPHRGQGLNNAIQDAYNLVQTIGRLVEEHATGTVVEEALDTYAEEVIERGAAEIKASLLNGKMMTEYYNFKSSPYAKQGFSKNRKS